MIFVGLPVLECRNAKHAEFNIQIILLFLALSQTKHRSLPAVMAVFSLGDKQNLHGKFIKA
jgi:hypothetical protein